MRKDGGFSAIALIITIIIIIIIAVIAINKLIGDDGIIRQYKQEDTEYNKTEVVEKLNLIIKEKYFGDYNRVYTNRFS